MARIRALVAEAENGEARIVIHGLNLPKWAPDLAWHGSCMPEPALSACKFHANPPAGNGARLPPARASARPRLRPPAPGHTPARLRPTPCAILSPWGGKQASSGAIQASWKRSVSPWSGCTKRLAGAYIGRLREYSVEVGA